METNKHRERGMTDRTLGGPLATHHLAWGLGLAAVLCACGSMANAQTPLSSAFTYQGQLQLEGQPLSGTADFEFTLWDADIEGNLVGDPVAVSALRIVNGQFTSKLDFGPGAFNGDARWMEIGVRSPAWDEEGEEPPFTLLQPRQALTATPYALQTRGIFVDEAGNVGIGNADPNHRLAIGAGTSDAQVVSLRAFSDEPRNWKGGAAFGYDSASVIMGELGDVATIGGHNAELSRWANLSINPGGGNVGIRTDAPEAPLHVVTGGTEVARFESTSTIGTWFNLHNTTAGDRFWRLLATGVSNGEGPGELVISTGDSPFSSQQVMTFEPNGRVGVATTDPQFTLHVNGSAGKPGGGTWSDSSDRRLKRNVTALDGREALDLLGQLTPVTYEWVHPQEHHARTEIGVLAQQVEEVFPHWITEVEPRGADASLIPEGEAIKAVTFPHEFNALTIQAVKELRREIETLRARIEALESSR